MDGMPNDLQFQQEWRRVVFRPDGTREMESGWYDDERIVSSILNEEYPERTSTGWFMRLETRWVTEARAVSTER
jgi:hypothetical protein